jgi:hypothetical protein
MRKYSCAGWGCGSVSPQPLACALPIAPLLPQGEGCQQPLAESVFCKRICWKVDFILWQTISFYVLMILL